MMTSTRTRSTPASSISTGATLASCGPSARARALTVVADVHTHPSGAGQSDSDRAHPIIARAGHLALIVPNLAAAPVTRQALGIYRYGGGGRWETIPHKRHRQFFHIGL